jgi:hypothetical protein
MPAPTRITMIATCTSTYPDWRARYGIRLNNTRVMLSVKNASSSSNQRAP